MSLFWLIFAREAKLAYRQRYDVINPLLFFLIIISLFPLSLSPDLHTLLQMAPGIIWIGVLLMTVLSLDRLFREDVDNGIIEQWILTRVSFTGLVASKIIAHWVIYYLPLLLLAPLLGEWLHLPFHALVILWFSLLLGTPTLSFIGAIFSALTIQLRQGGLLLALLILPFYVPVLIFASSAVANATVGLSVNGQLAFLGAMLALALPLAPLATAAALKIGMNV